MEQALFISKADNVKYFMEDFSRLYFGTEFCERLIPTIEDIKEILGFVQKKCLEFTLVTPYVTNRGLEKLEKILEFVAGEKVKTEIVFNDWGVLHLIHEQFPGHVPVMGRLLNKLKRGPRIMNIIDKVPGPTRDFYQGSCLDVPELCEFLKMMGVYRVEFDNLLQGTNLDATDTDIKKTLYMPFAFVSTTRFCLSAHADSAERPDYVGIFPCGRECRKYTFQLENPVMPVPLIRKGNAVFFLNENIPDSVHKGQVDRIVVEPEIPV